MTRRTRGAGRPAPVRVERARVLAHRAAVQDLAARRSDPAAAAVLRLGVQDTPAGSAAVAVRARSAADAGAVRGLAAGDGPCAVALTVRGAPHLLLRSELELQRAAVLPLPAEAAEGVALVAEAMRHRTADGTPVGRAALSADVTRRVPPALVVRCERCGTRHVDEALFRAATFQAGLGPVASGSGPADFGPLGTVDAQRVPGPGERERARAELVRRFLRLTGVARREELAAWSGHRAGEVAPLWDAVADDLAEVSVDGARRWALAEDVERLRDAQRPEGTRLLPPSDPYLLGERALLVPEPERRRTVWRAVGSPGVVLVDGGIAGTWRQRKAARGRIAVTVTWFGPEGGAPRDLLAAEAEEVARVRGASGADVFFG
jgi:hypothetical protein